MTVEEFKKLKPGDRVRIKNERGPAWACDGKMDKYMGQVVTINDIYGPYILVLDEEYKGREWAFDFEDIEEVVYCEAYNTVSVDDLNEKMKECLGTDDGGCNTDSLLKALTESYDYLVKNKLEFASFSTDMIRWIIDVLKKQKQYVEESHEWLRKAGVDTYLDHSKIAVYETFCNDLAAAAKKATDELNRIDKRGGNRNYT